MRFDTHINIDASIDFHLYDYLYRVWYSHVFTPFGHDGRHHWNDHEWQQLHMQAIMPVQLFQCLSAVFLRVHWDGRVCSMYLVIKTFYFHSILIIFFHREFSSTILGTVGCIWYLAWTFIVKGSPEQDKHISKDELRYIQESLGSNRNDVVVHPWKHIFTSKAVYAICASQFAENWGFYTSNSNLFSYFLFFFKLFVIFLLQNFSADTTTKFSQR